MEVLLTGHSLGAAAATLLAAAVDAHTSAKAFPNARVRITLVTFGSPRVGNRAFAKALDGSFQLRHWRVQVRRSYFRSLPTPPPAS